MLQYIDYTQRWVVSDNWTYTADLSPLKERLAEDSTEQTLLVFYGIDTIANIVSPTLFFGDLRLTGVQTYAGHPVAWVNNQFRQYVYDVSGLLASKGGHDSDTNLTVSLESAWLYGLNVTARPDAEHFPESISDDVRALKPTYNQRLTLAPVVRVSWGTVLYP